MNNRPKNAWHMLHDTRQLNSTFRVGNGGVSLRNPRALTAIIEKYGENTTIQENEDVFFVHYMHRERYRVAGKSVASSPTCDWNTEKFYLFFAHRNAEQPANRFLATFFPA